ncbi:hypothetical protein NH340_JMT04202 [Sarcoptes scabiei]|nr:hypothetical protein NH340_JMT04202 [Sarcoptes scabiei]
MSIVELIFLRWIRFTPSVLGSMCLLLLWPKIGDGPLFHSKYLDFIIEPCYRNWWISFIYMTNTIPSKEIVGSLF